MPRARTLLIGFAGSVVLGLLAFWQVPQWLDWTRYRSTIEVLATATLGQPVTIQGPISLILLPQPTLSAAQVNIGSGDADGISVHVDALRLRVALWPLIGGRVDARELVLRGPDFRIPWLAESGVLQTRPPAWLAAFAARIENGRLAIGRVVFTNIDATLATLDTGALSAAGTALSNGQDWHFTARLTAAGADGSAGLNVTLDGQGKAVGLGVNFSGQFAADGTLAGTLSSRGPNLAVLLPAPAVAFRADGRLTIGGGLVAADDLSLEIGGSPANGVVALRVTPQPRLDVAVAANRLDLDAWVPVLMRARNVIVGQELPIGIDLSAEAAQLGTGTLQHLRAAFELAGNDLHVREASAILPGNATLRASGQVARNDPAHPRFEGDVHIRAPVLQNTLNWLNETNPGLLPPGLIARMPASVLQQAELTAHVVSGADEISLHNLTGSIDGTTLSGDLGFRSGKAPLTTVDLAVGRMSFDPWLPAQPLNVLAERLYGSLGEVATLINAGNVRLRLAVRNAELSGTAINDIVLNAAIDSGSLTLHRLEAAAEGLHLLASGVLTETGRLSDGKFSLSTKDATPLMLLMPAAWRATPALWHGPASLDLQAAGPPEALGLQFRLAMADARLDAQPVVDLRSGEWKALVTLRHPGARRIVAAAGLPARLELRDLPAWLGDGSLSLVTHLAGSPGKLTAESLDLNAGSLHAGCQLTLDLNGAEPGLTGQISIDTLSLPMANVASDVPLPRVLLHGWQADLRISAAHLLADDHAVLRDVTTSLVLSGDVLRVERFVGRLGGGTVAGTLAYDTSAKPPGLTAQATLTDAVVSGALGSEPIDLLSGRANGSLQINASGYSPATVLATLTGHLQLTVLDGVLAGFDLFRARLAATLPGPAAAQASAIDALGSGATGFDRLDVSASFVHGDVVLDHARLNGSAGEATASGRIALARNTIDIRIGLSPAMPDPPEIGVRLAGAPNRPTRTPELASLARWFAERAR